MRQSVIALAVLILLNLFAAARLSASSDEDDKFIRQKVELLCQKGQKAEQRGELEDAVAFYEEAHETSPKHVLPLMYWADALCKAGLYSKANQLIEQIPIDIQDAPLRCLLYLRLGKIAVAQGSLEKAASAYSKALKADNHNDSALIHLAVMNAVSGNHSRAEELMAVRESYSGTSEDYRAALVLDTVNGDYGRALRTAEHFSEADGAGFIGSNSFLMYFMLLPWGMSGLFGFIYYFAIFSGLFFLSSRLSPPSAMWHNILFVVAAVCTMLGMQYFSIKSIFMAILQDDYFLNDTVWIVPKLLTAGHGIAYALFFIFPAFKLLPDNQRPKRYEYYGIWFFCMFFMSFVLIFQSNGSFVPRYTGMAISLLLAVLSSFCVPLGRFVIYKISSAIGFGSIAEIDRKSLGTAGTISFTDAKILETKAWKMLEKDDFNEAILTAKKILRSMDKKSFASLWKAMILALIASEDYIEAKHQIASYLKTFTTGQLYDSGCLFEALFKCKMGDFAGALKIIRGFSETAVRAFSADETALSLYILGCCGLSCKENVQGHIDLNKAFNAAKLPLIKAEVLVELAELDFKMNASESLAKTMAKSTGVTGGPKTSTLKLVLQSIASARSDQKAALETAKKACSSKVKCSRALAWYGHLLCKNGEAGVAEELLTRMSSGSYDAERLMTEVTNLS